MSQTTRAGGGAARRGPAQDLPVSEIARQLPEQLSRLVREELRLARIEMTQKGKRAGAGASMLGGGGVVAGYGAAAVLASIILALAKVVPAWAGALIVGAVLLALSAVFAWHVGHWRLADPDGQAAMKRISAISAGGNSAGTAT